MTANNRGGGEPNPAYPSCRLVDLRNLSIPAYPTCRLEKPISVYTSCRLVALSEKLIQCYNVFNLILENLSLPTPPVALPLCRFAVLIIHIDNITGKR